MSARRGLTGTVVPLEDKPKSRCRKWELRVNLPRQGKKYPKRTRRFEGTWTQAQAALREFIAEVESETAKPDGRALFSDYADAWHARRVELGMLSKRTLERESAPLAALKMHLGDKRLCEVTHRDIEDCYSALMSGDNPSGKPYAPWTVATAHQKLCAMLNSAVRDGTLPASPADKVRRPRVPEKEKRVPTTAEVDAMLDAMDFSDPRNVMVLLCAECGLRRSEALMVSPADFDGSRVHVSKAAEDDGTPKPTKNVMVREVPAPPRTKAVLGSLEGDGPICRMKPHSLSVWWAKTAKSHGMEGVTLHALRHAYATRLAEAGVHPKVMMSLGGWRTIEVCMSIYTHVHSSALDDAVSKAFS